MSKSPREAETLSEQPNHLSPPHGMHAGRHWLLLMSAAALSTGAVVAAGWFGVKSNALVGNAIALEMALVATIAWVIFDLAKQRDKAAALGRAASDDVAESAVNRKADQARRRLQEAYSMSHVFIVVPCGAVAAIALLQLFKQSLGDSPVVPPGTEAAAGCTLLAISFLWLVLSRSFEAIPADEIPEARGLGLAFREAQIACLLAATGLLGSQVLPSLGLWASRLILVWTVAASLEQIGRVAIAWISPAPALDDFRAPVQLFLRQSLLVGRNPLAALFDSIETRWGVGLRSSWAIRFVKTALPAMTLSLAVLTWSLSCLSIVAMDQLAVRENLGRRSAEALRPGLQLKLPWPLGKMRFFDVKKVREMPIGFVEGKQATGERALLWTKAHAEEEFSLVLGAGTEVIAVNAIVYYKIDEDDERFLDFVYHHQNPIEALSTYAYRSLTEATRSRSLAQVLSTSRTEFAEQLEESLRAYSRNNRLGIEVVDLAIINLHPPIEAAADYLDVISARLDARRAVVEASGAKHVAVDRAAMEGKTAIAQANGAAARRIADARGESLRFVALAEALAASPAMFKLRLWFEALEESLANKRLFVVDRSLAIDGGNVLMDLREAGSGGGGQGSGKAGEQKMQERSTEPAKRHLPIP